MKKVQGDLSLCSLVSALAVLAVLAVLGSCGGKNVPVVEPAGPGVGKVQHADGPAPKGDAPLPMTSQIKKGKLQNGLTYFIRKNGVPADRAEIWLAVNAGSILEDEDQRGLAHFLEHMAFNGTRRFEKQALVNYLEKIGMRFGADVNAYTSFDETVYMLQVPTDDPAILEQAFRILEDWATGITLDPEEVEKERGVVLEEWRLGRGVQGRLRDQQMPVIFHGSRYAERLPIGKAEIIKKAPVEALRRFYRDWYRPDLMAVVVVGDLDAQKAEELVKAHFSRLQAPAKPRERVLYPVPDHEETLVSVVQDPELTTSGVQVLYKLPKRKEGTAAQYRDFIKNQLWAQMFNDRLAELARQPGTPFAFAGGGAGDLSRTKDAFQLAAAAKKDQVEATLRVLMTELERVKQHGFAASELERAKASTLRRYQRAVSEDGKDHSRPYAQEILRHFFTGEPMPGIVMELELVERYLPQITLDEVNQLSHEWTKGRSRVVTVTGPKDAKLPDEKQVVALLGEVAAQQLAAYDDATTDAPLMASKPEPGRIVKETTVAEVGVTEWTLSNGAKVVLKPTEFKNDQILLTGFSPGGHSTVKDKDYLTASLASLLVGQSGLGAFDETQLRKLLTGKVAGASAFIGEIEEGVSGSASPRDMETMFQLVYLRFTAPRADEAAFQAWKETTRSYLEDRNKSPESVFFDKVTEVMTQGHLRRRPRQVEDLDKVDLQKALAFYKERFADASDFTFVLVGNFDLAGIRPLVETYLASLPATKRKDRWRDIGVKRPRRKTTIEVKKGIDEKSRVHIEFWGAARWSRQADHDMDSMTHALRTRLREVLREDMGGVYGVGVSGWISRRPRQEYGVRISFACAPDNVDSLIEATFQEIEALQKKGVDAALVEKIKNAQTRQREVDLRDNGFWRSVLASMYRYGDDPRLVLEYDKLIDSVSSERIRTAARQYLDPRRHLRAVLNPETTAP